jgi:lysophospholipase L1-like esterase
MKPLASISKNFGAALIAALLIISSQTVRSQTTPVVAERSALKPLNLLVLGDSISWGQGLKDEHKAWYLVKTWLQQNSGREVREHVLAHSGAVIGIPGEVSGAATGVDGELSRGWPSINEQVDDALKAYGDPRVVDLVIVDGCINDLDSRRLLNAANTPASIRQAAQLKCGTPMEALLTRITTVFPSAHVVVTGYYPIISEKTANDFFMRALAKRFYTPPAGVAPMNDKQLRARLIEISSEWYQASNQMLAEAARRVDKLLTAKGSAQKVRFAEIVFLPEHSFAANHTRLWGFNASMLRKFLVLVTLGRVTLKTNDERRNQRGAVCKETFKRLPNESLNEKQERENRLIRCRLAAIAHPNRRGAIMYAEAIDTQLGPVLTQAGWRKDLRPADVTATPGNPQQ